MAQGDYIASASWLSELARRAGLHCQPEREDYDLVVLGAGPHRSGVCGLGGSPRSGRRADGSGRPGRYQLEDRELSRLRRRDQRQRTWQRTPTQARLLRAGGSPHLSEIEVSGPNGDETLGVDGLFLLIGGDPLIATVENWLDVDEGGFLLTGPDLPKGSGPGQWSLEREPGFLESSVPGVFVAGDVPHGSIKRVASAVGEGAMAVALVHNYLSVAETALIDL